MCVCVCCVLCGLLQTLWWGTTLSYMTDMFRGTHRLWVSLNADAPLGRKQISCFMKTHKTLELRIINECALPHQPWIKLTWKTCRCPAEEEAALVLIFISFCQWMTSNIHLHSCWEDAAIFKFSPAADLKCVTEAVRMLKRIFYDNGIFLTQSQVCHWGRGNIKQSSPISPETTVCLYWVIL